MNTNIKSQSSDLQPYHYYAPLNFILVMRQSQVVGNK